MDHRTELRLLVELNRSGNARRAAEALQISQSTLSEALVRLERVYGTPLFVRNQRGSRPTAAGRVVVEAAARSLEILDNARREVGLMQMIEGGTLSIGADPSLIERYLVPTLASALGRYDQLHFRVHSGNPNQLLRLLNDKQVEFFIGLRPDGPLTGLTVREIDSWAGVPYCRKGHPLVGTAQKGVEVLQVYPLVGPHQTEWQLERLAAALPMDVRAAESFAVKTRGVELGDYAAVRALVKRSDAIAVAPYETIRADIKAGELVQLGLPDDQKILLEPLPIIIATLEERELPSAAVDMIKAIEAAIREKSAG